VLLLYKALRLWRGPLLRLEKFLDTLRPHTRHAFRRTTLLCEALCVKLCVRPLCDVVSCKLIASVLLLLLLLLTSLVVNLNLKKGVCVLAMLQTMSSSVCPGVLRALLTKVHIWRACVESNIHGHLRILQESLFARLVVHGEGGAVRSRSLGRMLRHPGLRHDKGRFAASPRPLQG